MHRTIQRTIGEMLTLQFIPCHRRPDRSVIIDGRQFPLCARCMGMFMGYFSIPILLWMDAYVSIFLGMILNLPMILDGYTQLKKWRESTNFLRIVTGLLSGVGQSMIVISVSVTLAGWIQH